MQPQQPESQTPPENENIVSVPVKHPNSRYHIELLMAALIILAIVVGTIYYLYPKKQPLSTAQVQQISQRSSTSSKASSLPGIQLDKSKKYGDKYASGVLPVGDKKYSADAAKQGYIYTCAGYARNISTTQNGGAGRQGPWFSSDGTTYDVNKKLRVQGNVTWQASFSNKVSGTTRTIITNDLPDHTTGVFPISAKDPAYAYDRNPNAIKGQTINYALNASPSYGGPQCMGGQVGVMLTGVVLFNGFDAEGRDAGAWEVQDSCGGHPEKNGMYHYHTLSSCIQNIDVQTVIGFALDGYPITGPKVSSGNILTTSDLDECHGLTSQVVLDGKNLTTYHYVMTQDFPYSLSCFRSKPLQTQPAPATPPH